MDWSSILMNALWAGIFASALGALLTAPPEGLVYCFVGGFVGRLVRNVLVAEGLAPTTAVMIAALACVLVTALVSYRSHLSLTAMVTGVLPLGAAMPLFQSIHALLTIPATPADALTGKVVQLVANLSTVFTSTLAVVLGMSLGLLIATLLGRKGMFSGS